MEFTKKRLENSKKMLENLKESLEFLIEARNSGEKTKEMYKKFLIKAQEELKIAEKNNDKKRIQLYKNDVIKYGNSITFLENSIKKTNKEQLEKELEETIEDIKKTKLEIEKLEQLEKSIEKNDTVITETPEEDVTDIFEEDLSKMFAEAEKEFDEMIVKFKTENLGESVETMLDSNSDKEKNISTEELNDSHENIINESPIEKLVEETELIETQNNTPEKDNSVTTEIPEEVVVANIFNSELNENKNEIKSELNQDELDKIDNGLDEIFKETMENSEKVAPDILSTNKDEATENLADDLKSVQKNNKVSLESNPLEEYSDISYVESEILNTENLVDVTEEVNNQEKKLQEELEKQTKKRKEEQEKQAIREEFGKLSNEEKWKKIMYHTKGVKLQEKFEIIPVPVQTTEKPKTEEPKTEKTEKKKR